MPDSDLAYHHLEVQIKELKEQLNQARFIAQEEKNKRNRLEEQLQRFEKRSCLLLNEMISGYALQEILLDSNGIPYDYRFLDANPAFEKHTGLKLEDILGKTIFELLPQTDPYWIKTYADVALHGKPVRFERFNEELDKYFDISAFSPEYGRFVVILNDITARKKSRKNSEIKS